ncbi:MAG: ribose 5-phosphate isomerase A [Thermoplasmata archaeon]|nr:MAG: ribose 5-phosphate isomerase A [Thermoplasmata archaeon]
MEDLKRIAGEAAASLVNDGMVIGLGTGSTVRYAILEIGRRVKEGMEIVGIPTSKATEQLARSLGIPLGTLEDYEEIDLTIDGADEVDEDLDLIKGRGGALFREKVVAKSSQNVVIVVDEGKLVPTLGTKAPLPVEVVPFSVPYCMRKIKKLGIKPKLRMSDGHPYITDNGNNILDCDAGPIVDKVGMEKSLKEITGVVESGLFIGIARRVYVGTKGGLKILERE